MSILKYIDAVEKNLPNIGKGGGFPDKTIAYIMSGIFAAGQIIFRENASFETKEASSQKARAASETVRIVIPENKIRHYDIYITDGYINISSGAWPPAGDNTAIPGWSDPVYIWGFTDIDPNISGNLMTVPPGAYASAGSPVGNAKFPGPFLEAMVGDEVYITVHNRGLFQSLQNIQDDYALHLHGLSLQSPYDGFPESAGGYGENLRYFWEEDWFKSQGASTKERDDWWNSLTAPEQHAHLRNTPLIKPNQLNQNGCIYSLRNTEAYPEGVGSKLPYGVAEDWTQFTYHFHAMRPGTYIYCCQTAPDDIQMGLYGAMIVQPADFSPENKTVYGRGTETEFDLEHTFILGEFDPVWHRFIEGDSSIPEFLPADCKSEIWFINGRSFPQTMLPFAWNRRGGNAEPEQRYNTHIKVAPKERLLIRYMNMGYQTHSINQHGWTMCIIGSDGYPCSPQSQKTTLSISPGETYETITIIDPTYGVNSQAGSPLSSIAPAPVGHGTLTWRQIFPIRDHNDCVVTTRNAFPGGMMTLIEATGASNVPAGKPIWFNPYSDRVEPWP